jgi:hypothetical protein
MRWRQGAESCSIPNAGVGQALAKWMRQRRGAPIPNADVPQAPAKRMRQRQGANFLLPFQRRLSAALKGRNGFL